MATFHPFGGQTYNLGSSIGSTDTSILLSSFTEPVTGTPYTMILINSDIAYGTIQPTTSSSEFISFTGITQNSDGTATLTGVTRGLQKKYPFTSDAALKLPHSGQSIFIISDVPQLFEEYIPLTNDVTVSGIKTFSSFPITPSAAPTLDYQVANKKYVDDIAIAGAPDASTTVKGISKLSVAPVSPIDPIAAGTNDPRIPTQDENDALVGTSGSPSTSNKYVTNDDTASAATASKVARRNATGDVTVPSTPTAGTDAGSKTYIDTADTAIAATVTLLNNGSVNSIGTNATTHTTEIQAPMYPLSGNSIWSITGSSNNTLYTNGSQMSKSNATTSAVAAMGTFKSTASTGALLFSETPVTQLKFNVRVKPGTGTTSPHNWTFIGYITGAANANDGNITSITTPRLGLAAYNGNLYFLASDGVANTTVTIGAYSAVAGKEITIYQNGTTSATMYVNGVAQTPITTNIPTTGAVSFAISSDSDVGGVTGVDFISHITFTQTL